MDTLDEIWGLFLKIIVKREFPSSISTGTPFVLLSEFCTEKGAEKSCKKHY